VPVPVLAEQRAEARRRVESRQAEPVDRAVPGHQRSGVEVADERVILDHAGHSRASPSLAAAAEPRIRPASRGRAGPCRGSSPLSAVCAGPGRRVVTLRR
jgi:hypothetical protein